MHHSKKITQAVLIGTALTFVLASTKMAWAKPEALSFVLAQKKSKKGAPKLVTDYEAYWHAQKIIESKKAPVLSEVEAAERAVLVAKLNAPSRSLEKELEELFWAMEFKRGEAFAAHKNTTAALAAFQRGMQGLPNLKWPFYWRDSSSDALAKLCYSGTRKPSAVAKAQPSVVKTQAPSAKAEKGAKKSKASAKTGRSPKEAEPVKNDECLVIAKRIAEVFPKSASETKVLRDLPNADPAMTFEASGDRLSAVYPSEKVDKDEKLFDDIVVAFLAGSQAELESKIDELNKSYPRSGLRFRAQFLLAELYTKKGKSKEAEKIYTALMDQTPLGYQALIAAERLKVSFKDRLKKQPLVVDSEQFNFGPQEKISLARIDELTRLKKWDEVGIELNAFQRNRAYTTDAVIYLMGLANKTKQNLGAFRLVSELVQRQYPDLLNSELMEIIFPFSYEKEITDIAKSYKLDPLLVMSLIKQESGFRSNAISSSGALGLMQLMPFTAVDVQPEVKLFTLKDALPNINVGTKYFASLLEKNNGNIVYALASYNAGPHRVSKWRKDLAADAGMIEFIESIPFKETREYVVSILRNRYWYQVRKGIPPTSLFDSWVK